ncbi:uncharacterized protein [Manis javanica]|uniref:uncharacterized protein isoform X1 n=1 Tax=Manis javanica TaxID=9974 RepID=UPI003C6D2664
MARARGSSGGCSSRHPQFVQGRRLPALLRLRERERDKAPRAKRGQRPATGSCARLCGYYTPPAENAEQIVRVIAAGSESPIRRRPRSLGVSPKPASTQRRAALAAPALHGAGGSLGGGGAGRTARLPNDRAPWAAGAGPARRPRVSTRPPAPPAALLPPGAPRPTSRLSLSSHPDRRAGGQAGMGLSSSGGASLPLLSQPGPLSPPPGSARPAPRSCLSPAASGGGAPEQPTSRRSRAPISSPYEMKFHRGIRKEMRPGRSVLLGPPPFLSRGHGF